MEEAKVEASVAKVEPSVHLHHEYEKVREEAVKEVEKEDDSASCSVEDQEDTKQEEAEKTEKEVTLTERPPKKPEKTEKEKKPEKPKKPRWTCPDCGKSLSVTTKKGRHKCYVLPKEPAAPAAPVAPAAPDRVASPPVPSSDPEPASRQVTLDDVTHFLWANQQERSRIRRERLMAQMF